MRVGGSNGRMGGLKQGGKLTQKGAIRAEDLMATGDMRRERCKAHGDVSGW
jgi:hypothetical protein